MCCIMGFLSDLYSAEEIRPYFDRTKSRGPDDTRIEPVGAGLLCFHRLSIMGLVRSAIPWWTIPPPECSPITEIAVYKVYKTCGRKAFCVYFPYSEKKRRMIWIYAPFTISPLWRRS